VKVSIVTISYNQEQFLEQCIQSVLNQSYPDIEYIVVDPGSKDGSQEIIEHYHSNLSKIIFEPDLGPADGLNKGFRLATGAIFGYLNSDDYLLRDAITKVVDYFQKHPDIDVVSGNAQVINDRNELLRYTYSDKYSLLGCAYGYSTLIQPSSFFRSGAFYKTKGFNIENRSNWDGELFIDMKLNHAKFGRMNEILSAYRIYEKSITGSGNLDNLIKSFSNYRFVKIMGRERNIMDSYLDYIFRFYRYLTNPRDLYQRIRFGPIYARYSTFLKEKR